MLTEVRAYMANDNKLFMTPGEALEHNIRHYGDLTRGMLNRRNNVGGDRTSDEELLDAVQKLAANLQALYGR